MNSNGSKRQLEEELYERQVGICKAFANPTRLRILDYVSRRPYDGSSLQRALGVSMANLSQHLAILKAAGVVNMQRRGRHVYCSLSIPEVKQACELIRGVLRAQIRSGRRLSVSCSGTLSRLQICSPDSCVSGETPRSARTRQHNLRQLAATCHKP